MKMFEYVCADRASPRPHLSQDRQGSTAATEAIRPTSQGSRRDLGVLRFRLGEVQCEGVI